MFAVPVPPPDSTTSGYSVPCTRKRIGSPSAAASATSVALGLLERADELAPDDLALLLGVADARRARSRNCSRASIVTRRTPVEAT